MLEASSRRIPLANGRRERTRGAGSPQAAERGQQVNATATIIQRERKRPTRNAGWARRADRTQLRLPAVRAISCSQWNGGFRSLEDKRFRVEVMSASRPTPATALVRNLLLNCGQRTSNFTDDAARLKSHSRRARELVREAFFDEKHSEASPPGLSNERPSLFAPFEMKRAVTLTDFRRDIHASVGYCQRPCLLALVHNSLIVRTLWLVIDCTIARCLSPCGAILPI